MSGGNGMEIIMMNEEEETIDWLDLPYDLLAQISDKVICFSLADYLRFCCVCVQWRSFLIENNNNNNYEQIKLSHLPVLLIPSLSNHHHHHHHSSYSEKKVEDDNESGVCNYYDPKDIWRGLDYGQRHHSTRSVYSLFEGKVYDFEFPIPSYMNFRGSSHGWVLVVEEECRSDDGTSTTFPVHLFNPFRRPDQKNNKIHLPPLSTFTNSFYSYNLTKAFFSRDPSSYTTTDDDDDDNNKLVVLGYCLGMVVFCRPDDEAWTPMPTPTHSPTLDVIFYKGKFWGILQNGSAVVFDIAPEPKFTILVDPAPYPDEHTYPRKRYLVESAGGDLFHVRRDFDLPYDDDGNYSTEGFLVFKLEPMTMQWVKTNTLDGCMFFLGDNTSMSFSVAEYYPPWCKPNSIYFTDDLLEGYIAWPWRGPSDIGVFNLEAGSFEPLYSVDSKPILPAPPIMPAPIWIQPNL